MDSSNEAKTKTKRILVIALINIIGVVALCAVIKIIFSFNFECIWYTKHGIYCMTCGMTRAIEALMHFKIYQAFRYNELLFVLMAYGLYLDIATSIYFYKYGVLKVKLIPLVAVAIIGFSFMLLRNIPIFNFLQPTVL